MANHARFKSLEARMDAQLHSFRSSDEEETGGAGLARTAGLGVAGAAGVAGATAAYRNRAALKSGAQDLARTGLKKTARGASLASNAAHRQAIRGKNPLLKKAGAAVATPLGRAATRLRGVARGFSAGEAEQIARLAERIAAIELEAEEDLREFKDYGPQRDPAMVQYAGRQANGYLGGREALLARDKFATKGHVYRKRDAVRDGVKGNLSGAALAGGTVAGGVLGARGLMKAAAGGQLKKGGIRKAGVKAAQTLKKAGKSRAVAIGGLAAAGIGGHLAGTRIQRRSADKRLAKREQEA
jgi:hypothetical protein